MENYNRLRASERPFAGSLRTSQVDPTQSFALGRGFRAPES
jgi:hypothetical protein